MNRSAIDSKSWKAPRLPRPVGAIFAKELRVSSRRKRHYWVRFAYLILLTLFVGLVWMEQGRSLSGRGVFSVSRMAEVGKSVTIVILLFQFIAIQLVAVIQLSPSISGEIRARTLGALLSTPLTSGQIVLGKLLSGLWNLLLLLALSLPLLAIVRVFGGVPWDLVVGGICVTVTSAVFVAAVAILVSIFCRQTYVAILATMAVLGVLFALIPFLLFLILDSLDLYSLMRDFREGWHYVHPVGALSDILNSLAYPGRGWRGGSAFVWPVHCVVMLVASGVVLVLCVLLVRRVAFRRAMGGGRRREPRHAAAGLAAVTGAWADLGRYRRIRHINGSPILWKELRRPLLKSRKWRWGAGAAVLGLLGLIYLLLAAENDLTDDDTQIVFALVFVMAGVLVTAVLSATAVSGERESRTLPLLLCSDLAETHIIFGKGLGVARRTLPTWALLFVHLLLFCLFGALIPLVVFQMAIIVTCVVVFLTGSGLYFSTVFRRTTGAVAANLALGLALWAIVPLIMALALDAARVSDSPVEIYLGANPFVQTVVVVEAGASRRPPSRRWGGRGRRYDWPHGRENARDTTLLLFLSLLVHGSVGAGLARMAASRLRYGPRQRAAPPAATVTP